MTVVEHERSERSETLVGSVLGLLLAAGGAGLLFTFSDPDSFVSAVLAGLGSVLLGAGAWLAFTESRRLLDPEALAAEEAEEAERDRARHQRAVTLPGVLFTWILATLYAGFLLFYAVDDSGQHGERTLGLTLFFVGMVTLSIGLAAGVTLNWRRQQGKSRTRPESAST